MSDLEEPPEVVADLDPDDVDHLVVSAQGWSAKTAHLPLERDPERPRCYKNRSSARSWTTRPIEATHGETHVCRDCTGNREQTSTANRLANKLKRQSFTPEKVGLSPLGERDDDDPDVRADGGERP